AFKVVTKVSPTPAQLRDILFGILVSRYVKSNSIVLVQGERTVGIGAGQMSRVDACVLACLKAKGAARASVAVSDAYVPARGALYVELAALWCNVPGAAVRDRAKAANVPAVVIDHRPYGKDREGFEREVLKILREKRVELVVFAGFMRLVSAAFIRAFPNRII